MIRKAQVSDIDFIMPIYDTAKLYMAANGNPNQWVGGYPSREQILSDIEKSQCYVLEESGEIHAAFIFIIGEDPTYGFIEGQWLNQEPYGTIHRIASDGKIRGVFEKALNYCLGQISNIRIDTHEDNKIMQAKILENGFTHCGTIYLASGAPRLAFQFVR